MKTKYTEEDIKEFDRLVTKSEQKGFDNYDRNIGRMELETWLKGFNEETKEFEGGYYPDKETYQVDEKGNLMYDNNGNPMLEEGFIKQQFKKIPGMIKDLLTPGTGPGINTSKLPLQPLPPQPAATGITATAAAPINPATGLTQVETALLSPGEQAIRLKQRA